MGKEVVADRLDIAVVGLAELADGLEVLFGSPTLREDRKRQRNRDRSHGEVVGEKVVATMGKNKF